MIHTQETLDDIIVEVQGYGDGELLTITGMDPITLSFYQEHNNSISVDGMKLSDYMNYLEAEYNLIEDDLIAFDYEYFAEGFTSAEEIEYDDLKNLKPIYNKEEIFNHWTNILIADSQR